MESVDSFLDSLQKLFIVTCIKKGKPDEVFSSWFLLLYRFVISLHCIVQTFCQVPFIWKETMIGVVGVRFPMSEIQRKIAFSITISLHHGVNPFVDP